MSIISHRLFVYPVCLVLILLKAELIAFGAPCVDSAGSITFIDVGEGDAALIQSGNASALVDAGNLITGQRVLELLQKRRLRHLNQIILTHPHPDHIGGIFSIAQSVSFDFIHDNGEYLGDQTQDLFRWYTELVRNSARYSPLKAGNQFRIGALNVEVLWPAAKERSKDWNTNSLALAIRFNKFQAILMGDGNFATEARLLREHPDIRAQVLKVGHHGAGDSSSLKFLQKVSPKVSIISVNSGNARGYPSSQTIARLEQESKIYRTDQSGSIILSLCKDGSYEINAAK